MPDHAITIERFELKFFIDEAQADAIRDFAAPWMEPDSNNPERGGYTIHSLYYDTVDWALYAASKRNDADRVKLRVRTYDSGPAFLEVKRKVGDVIEKTRARVDRSSVEDAVAGYGAGLTSAREQRALDRFAYFAARLGAMPRVNVRYTREAFVGHSERYARLTFDRRIVAQPAHDCALGWAAQGPCYTLDDAWRFDNFRSPVVLELKCESRVPLWMLDLIRRFSLVRTGFSKYGFGALAVESRGRGLDHVAWVG